MTSPEQNPYDPPEPGAEAPHSSVPCIPEHPLSLAEVIGLAWRVFRLALPQVLIVTWVVHAPLEILIHAKGNQFDFSMSRSSIEAFRMIQLFDFVFGILATLAIASLVEQSLEGPVSLAAATKTAFSRWGHALATNLRAGLVTFGLLLLGIVPGIIWALYYCYSSYIVATRRMSGKYALDYSKSLVKGQWWRTFFFLAVFFVLALLPALAGAFVIGMVKELLLPTISIAQTGMDILVALLMDTALSFFTIQAIILFFNMEKLQRARSSPIPRAVA